jgi:dihydrodipicolinate synthase/N-acetylneuraminate lyase
VTQAVVAATSGRVRVLAHAGRASTQATVGHPAALRAPLG